MESVGVARAEQAAEFVVAVAVFPRNIVLVLVGDTCDVAVELRVEAGVVSESLRVARSAQIYERRQVAVTKQESAKQLEKPCRNSFYLDHLAT